MIWYLEGAESGIITYVVSHKYAKVKVDLYDSFPLEETMTFHNVVILSKSVWNKDKNSYYYNIFSEKAYESNESILIFE